MCGILCIVSCDDGRLISCETVQSASETPAESRESNSAGGAPTAAWFQSSLHHRGPDAVESIAVECGNAALELHASLLQLRGAVTCPALKCLDNCLLCFNGEVFGGLPVGDDENDGDVLCQALVRGSASGQHVPEVLSRLQGPWSLVFWDNGSGVLWFGRDVFGRRRHALLTVVTRFIMVCSDASFPQPPHEKTNGGRPATLAGFHGST